MGLASDVSPKDAEIVSLVLGGKPGAGGGGAAAGRAPVSSSCAIEAGEIAFQFKLVSFQFLQYSFGFVCCCFLLSVMIEVSIAGAVGVAVLLFVLAYFALDLGAPKFALHAYQYDFLKNFGAAKGVPPAGALQILVDKASRRPRG